MEKHVAHFRKLDCIIVTLVFRTNSYLLVINDSMCTWLGFEDMFDGNSLSRKKNSQGFNTNNLKNYR